MKIELTEKQRLVFEQAKEAQKRLHQQQSAEEECNSSSILCPDTAEA